MDTTADQTARPVVAHVDWTHREGTRTTGLITFADLGPLDERRLLDQGREPQFHLTGSTRRTTVDAFNDYGPDQFTAHRAPLTDVVAQAAAWLGLTAPIDIREHDETR